MICDMNCLECKFSDCINDSDFLTQEERQSSRFVENLVKDARRPKPDLTSKYIHNRVDKEEYTKARDRAYEKKRAGSPKRREAKKKQYQRHREAKLAYQHNYYDTHREECNARSKARYFANHEKEKQYRRESYAKRKEQERIDQANLIITELQSSGVYFIRQKRKNMVYEQRVFAKVLEVLKEKHIDLVIYYDPELGVIERRDYSEDYQDQ